MSVALTTQTTINPLPEIVSGSPVRAILAPPVAVDDESLGKREDEGVGHALGEPGEEVET